MYAPKIFDKQPNAEVLSALMSVIQVIFALFAIPLVDRLGRRTLLLIGAIICSIGHLVCCIAIDEDGEDTTRNWVFNVGILLFVGVFNPTFGAITYFPSSNI